jgi:hypothetical protein
MIKKTYLKLTGAGAGARAGAGANAGARGGIGAEGTI